MESMEAYGAIFTNLTPVLPKKDKQMLSQPFLEILATTWSSLKMLKTMFRPFSHVVIRQLEPYLKITEDRDRLEVTGKGPFTMMK